MIPIVLAIQAATFKGVETEMLPLVFLALLIDSAIVTVWYMLGSMLGNATVKVSARSELYQVGGTALLAVLIVALLTVFSSAFYNVLGTTQLLNPQTTNGICQGIMANSKLTLLGPKGAILSGGAASGSGSPFPGFCNMVKPVNLQAPTNQIDYPLAVTGVIVANLTNQTITNLNDAFVVDSFLGFLSTLQPEIRVCYNDDPIAAPESVQCLSPLPDPIASTTYITLSFQPYAGFDFIYKSLTDLGTMLTNAYTLFIAQLVFIVVFVFIWPYLLFMGLVLRSTPFTRGVGGLLIAVAIGMVLFYPLMYTTEYLVLGSNSNAAVQSNAQAYGYSYITGLPGRGAAVCPGEVITSTGAPLPASCKISADTTGCSNSMIYSPVCFTSLGKQDSGNNPVCPQVYNAITKQEDTINPTCNYTLNFFVEPSIEEIARTNQCWPHVLGGASVDLYAAEAGDVMTLLIPLYSAIGPLVALVSNGFHLATMPSFPLPFVCTSDHAFATLKGMMQSFGIIGISAYIVPILNLVITLTAILGVSGLLGGDTSLAGIAKLL